MSEAQCSEKWPVVAAVKSATPLSGDGMAKTGCNSMRRNNSIAQEN
jgi:hypothetical protein